MNNYEKVQHCIELLTTDLEAALKLLADDVAWTNLLPEHVPFGGVYCGKQGLVSYLTKLAETFVLGSYDWDGFDVIESGNALVIVGCEVDGKVIPTGKVFDLPFVWVVKFNDEGKISFLQEHNDTAAIGDAFRP